MEEKKVLYTLAVDNYEPDMCKITLPLLRKYADKICADFVILDKRKFPDFPPVMEKFQIWELANGKYKEYDWHIYFDADTLIHPNFWDMTAVMAKDTTASFGTDFVPVRFQPNRYFLRDGRFIGKGNWCAVVSNWCLDYWSPPPRHQKWEHVNTSTLDIYASYITPTNEERISGVIDPHHLLDDYFVSLNIARYGLKHLLIPELANHFRTEVNSMLWHQYLIDSDQKLVTMQDIVDKWRINL